MPNLSQNVSVEITMMIINYIVRIIDIFSVEVSDHFVPGWFLVM